MKCGCSRISTRRVTDEGLSEPREDADFLPAPTPPQTGDQTPSSAGRPFVFDDRDKKLAYFVEGRIERRMMAIIRQESGDSYAGLPADHVLENLHRQFPEVNFPERMM